MRGRAAKARCEAAAARPTSGDPCRLVRARSQIWPAETFVDFDHSIHNAIARIREVLGDSAETPRYIETLPRRGYRFIAPVKVVEISVPQPSAQSGQPSEVSADVRPSKSHALLAFAVLTVVIGSAFWLERKTSPPASAAHRLDSIAVLPLDNLSGEASEDFSSMG